MVKAIDLTGQAFGRLRVIAQAAPSSPPRGEARWDCLCDKELGGCGNAVTVLGRSLRSGRTKSCGCMKSEICAKTRAKVRATRATNIAGACFNARNAWGNER